MKYLEAVEEVKYCVNQNNFKSRSSRYQILELLTGISAGTCEKILRYDRAIRDVFPKDEVGEAEEEKWHLKDYQKTFINEKGQNQLFKSIIKSL
jgi:hypothetical protein